MRSVVESPNPFLAQTFPTSVRKMAHAEIGKLLIGDPHHPYYALIFSLSAFCYVSLCNSLFFFLLPELLLLDINGQIRITLSTFALIALYLVHTVTTHHFHFPGLSEGVRWPTKCLWAISTANKILLLFHFLLKVFF